jgi:hypothetical protein
VLRKLTILYITPLIWKYFPARKAQALQEFSSIEKDSGCQLLWALELIPDPKYKAYIFQHVIEEFYHAEIFEDLSNVYTDNYLVHRLLPREMLVNKKSTVPELYEFFSYAHVGEKGVNKDFSYYLDAPIDQKISAVFNRVVKDENNHVYDTDDILKEMTSKKKFYYEYLVLKSTVIRKLNEMKKTPQWLAEILLNIVLGGVFYTFGFLAHLTVRKRFNELSEAEILDYIKEQSTDV